MPTDDERLAVARRLRRSRSEWSGMGWRLWLGPKFCAVVLSDGNRDELEDAANLLADLIEPQPERTCRWEHIEGTLFVTECGETYGRVVPDNYCPHCGAKVVDE